MQVMSTEPMPLDVQGLVALTLLFVYGSVPWVSLLFPAWVAASSVLILVRRRDVGQVDGA
jgi:hypothetical protein